MNSYGYLFSVKLFKRKKSFIIHPLILTYLYDVYIIKMLESCTIFGVIDKFILIKNVLKCWCIFKQSCSVWACVSPQDKTQSKEDSGMARCVVDLNTLLRVPLYPRPNHHLMSGGLGHTEWFFWLPQRCWTILRGYG